MRGDAIAGLLIIFINIIGGMIIGIAQQGMPFAEAARTYTLLTVGDGLVTQIPALIVSTAAGLLVSKAGVAGAADKALVRAALRLSQGARHVGRRDGASWRCCPACRCCRSCCSAAAPARSPTSWTSAQKAALAAEAQGRGSREGRRRAEEPIAAALKIDELKIELGYALLPLVNATDGADRLTEQIKALRRSLAIELGFVMPPVRILDNVQLEANSYVIKIKEVEAGTGQIWPGQYMVMDPTGAQVNLPGHAHHRADLRPARDLGRRRARRKRRRSRATRSSTPRPCSRRI